MVNFFFLSGFASSYHHRIRDESDLCGGKYEHNNDILNQIIQLGLDARVSKFDYRIGKYVQILDLLQFFTRKLWH